MARYRRNSDFHTAAIGYIPVVALGGIVGISYVVGYDKHAVNRRAHQIAWQFARAGKRLGLLEWDRAPFVIGYDGVPDSVILNGGPLPLPGEVQFRFKSSIVERKYHVLKGAP